MTNYIDKIAIANTSYDVNSFKTNGVFYGNVDSSSTATVFTATVEGLTSLTNGTIVVLHNGIETSASGFTINVNNLGAKPVYSNMATGNDITPTAPTRDTTIFNINYTMMFIYDADLVDGGAWICYRGYDSNSNTIGYQLRGNSSTRPAADKGYRYRLWLSSADNQSWVPINTSTATDATTSRALNTRAIDPFGEIIYYSANETTNATANLTATTIWQQYTLSIGYSYVKTLTAWDPVYLKCQPQSNGSAIMKDIVQILPTTNDGYIYIYLGIAYSTTAMELRFYHPVYYHDGTGIRIWTGKTIPTKVSELTNDSGFITDAGVTSFNGSTGAITYTAPVTSVNGSTGAITGLATTSQIPAASSTTPSMDGTAAIGTATTYARADHVHPTDTSRQATLVSGTNIKTINGTSILGSGDLTVGGSTVFYQEYGNGNVSTGKLTIDGTDYEIWAYSQPSKATSTPLMDGTAAIGNSDRYAAENHVHPTDTSRQATLVSGTNIKTVGNQSLLGSGNLTASDIGAAESSHAHGNITSGGDITATAAIASGDRLVINDESASKVTNSSITFGSNTNQYLANNGTWQTVPSGGGGGSTVTVTQTVTAGTQIASISVDGSSTALYTPTPAEEVSISSTQPSADSDLKIWIEI